jgi:hypothetical protein
MPVEDNNQLVHARSMPVADGVVLSVPALTPTQEESLRRVGLHRVSDLLRFRAVHDAQLISALALGRVVHAVEITPLLDASAIGSAPDALVASPVDVLAAIDDDVACELNGVQVRKEPMNAGGLSADAFLGIPIRKGRTHAWRWL